jgi:hypothetical protein
MRSLILILLSLVIVFTQSCTTKDDESLDSGTKNELVNKNDLYIDREPTSISTVDANKMATLFKGVTPMTRAATSYEVTTLSDSVSGQPLMYVINYGHDNGFVVISASKNTQPILAFSDKGKFVFDTDHPSMDLMNNFKQIVKEAQLCTPDSLRIKYALQWAYFEKTPETVLTRALPSEIEERKAKEREYQESRGYKCLGDLATAQYFLSFDDYEAFMREMEDSSDPQYDYRNVVQIFVKTIRQDSIGELLQTKWHQYAPFNTDASNGFAGCTPIAIAQIAYYHKYPLKYDWDNIAIDPVYNSALSNLMHDIWDACDAKFKEGKTRATIQDAKKTFEKFGYKVSLIDNYITNDDLSSQIKAGNPVYIRGKNSEGKGHAWVCDGYKWIRDMVIATLIKKPNDPRFKIVPMSPNDFMIYDATGLKKKDSDDGEYFHMNFGWGGESDAWYYSFKYAIPNNYINDQKILTVKKK